MLILSNLSKRRKNLMIYDENVGLSFAKLFFQGNEEYSFEIFAKSPELLRKHVTGEKKDGRSAVIIGATGTKVKNICYQKIQLFEPKMNKKKKQNSKERRGNICLGIKKEEELTEEEKKKLTQHAIDMGKILDEQKLFEAHDVTFCVLGTTRNAAGTAENFKKIDFDMVKDAAIASQKASLELFFDFFLHVPHFSLMTAQGANANVWANEWKIGHGLYYLKIKGLIENEIIDMKFPRTSIFRPGVLERPNTDRWAEKAVFFPKTHVATVATAMIIDAESEQINPDTVEKPIFYENAVIGKIGVVKL
ncbi:hypothetical protein RFI_01123 [Reticulomyxa filosa]|uniref:Uncharacterized protein n=1 Tax=Reticulomyxa filosa TaxID=46433 RepID=X6PE44_RETFI|nr:hypothetical protein RFI_01123 [Reticulomyxa filosa]|eukprot:ETO35937.1 hypothetical protein RFI_01123 [Reticulomyxa filosa]